jgi:hypothetical protein
MQNAEEYHNQGLLHEDTIKNRKVKDMRITHYLYNTFVNVSYRRNISERKT